VVVWESHGSNVDTSGSSIQGQLYAADGSPLGSEIQINSYTTSDQWHPAVAMDAGGNFVVVWQSVGSEASDETGNSVQARRFAPEGSPLGVEFQVNTYTMGFQGEPAVAVQPNGRFVVVWESDGSAGSDGSSYSIQAQRYGILLPLPPLTEPIAYPIGEEFQVNLYTTYAQEDPSVVIDPLGNFAVAWTSSGSDGSDQSGSSVQARLFASDGMPSSGEFQVNTYTTGDQAGPSLAMDSGGSFTVAWPSEGSAGSDSSYSSVQGQRYAASGTPIGGEFQVNTYTTSLQTSASAAIGSGGDLVVVWETVGLSRGEARRVQAQRYTGDGLPLATDFQVNTYTYVPRPTAVPASPAVAVGPDGRFVVVWGSDISAETDPSWAIQARRYIPEPGAPLLQLVALAAALGIARRRITIGAS